LKVSVRYLILISFFAGILAGLGLNQAFLWKNNMVLINASAREQHLALIAELREENNQLTEELFTPQSWWYPLLTDDDLPYDGEANAQDLINSERQRALKDSKFLMVTFGANWCQDCRTLHAYLKKGEVADYTKELFYFVNVDVGKFNQNANVAAGLGVSLSKGIPVAIFFDPSGQLIGTTNDGQLEPARRYTSKQILKFIKDVAERSRILAPDAVR
jgi:thioredoxin 1